ncbi:MAG TPA: hypothetical protein VFE45_13375, partial [Coriobacteriia bacterium]|nr:hypothetical protein [Coriobacteriia bacterium]
MSLGDAEPIRQVPLRSDHFQGQDMRSTVAGKMAEERRDVVAVYLTRPRQAIPVGRRLESAAGQSQAASGGTCTEQGDECQLLVTHDTSSE